MKKLAALLALLALISTQLFGWSARGHAIVAALAYSRLTPVAKKNIHQLLGDDNLAAIASWADEVRRDRDESYGWHFVDIPKDAAGFDDSRDCFRPQDKHANSANDHHNCVVDRIEMFRAVLADENASKKDRVEALKFLVHFVADLHQPLHAVEEGRGGNDIKVTVFGSDRCGNYPCNLHGAWDYSLIEHTGLNDEDYLRHLQEVIRDNQLELRAGGKPEDWANESHLAARQILDENAASLDQAYYQANISLVDERLALAGLRLAALLNDTLGKIPPRQLAQDLEKHSGTQ